MTRCKAAGPSLGPAFEGITRISEVITKRDAQIAELLEASRSISTQLSDSTGDLTELMRQSNLVIEELIKRREAIRDLLSDVSSITASIEGILDDNADKLGPTLKDLRAITTVLNARDKELRTALHNLAVGSRYFANATGDGPFINLYFTDASRTSSAVASRGRAEMKRLLGSSLAIALIAVLGGCSLPGCWRA